MSDSEVTNVRKLCGEMTGFLVIYCTTGLLFAFYALVAETQEVPCFMLFADDVVLLYVHCKG